LHRLEERGWLLGEWGETESNRRAKFYALTKTGRRQLTAETRHWKKLTGAVSSILEST
jgi:DNA-binding PadR family transcriptional regulator